MARVLSIQSHVVHGYVGNKCATFPLQLLGIEVDPIHTVQFSNHTRYSYFTGERYGSRQIQSLVEGLKQNGLTRLYTHVLSGYIGQTDTLETMGEIVKNLKKDNPNLLFFMDTVMGDDCKVYVPQECIQVYKKLCPLADVITPNWFEAELLSGIPLIDTKSVQQALDKIHQLGARTIIITSTPLPQEPGSTPNTLYLFASHRPLDSKDAFCGYISFPKVGDSFTGTGDLFAALLLARMKQIQRHDIIDACEAAVASMQEILSATQLKSEQDEHRASVSSRELCIVQSPQSILNPTIQYRFIELK